MTNSHDENLEYKIVVKILQIDDYAVNTMIFVIGQVHLILMMPVADNRHDRYDFGKFYRFPKRMVNANKNDSNCDYGGTSTIQRIMIPIMIIITLVRIKSVKMKYFPNNFMMITMFKYDYDPNYEANLML